MLDGSIEDAWVTSIKKGYGNGQWNWDSISDAKITFNDGNFELNDNIILPGQANTNMANTDINGQPFTHIGMQGRISSGTTLYTKNDNVPNF